MNSKTKILLLSAAAVSGIALAGIWGYDAWKERSYLGKYFCADMGNEATYDKYNIEHYRMLIPGRGDRIFRTENDFRTDWHVEDRTIKYLQRLQAALKTHNADLVLAFAPSRGMTDYNHIKSSYRRKLSLNDNNASWKSYQDMLDTFNKNGLTAVGVRQEEAGEDFFYSTDHHWTAVGAKAMAKNIANSVQSIPSYQSAPAVEYITEQGEDIYFNGSLAKGFEKICETDLPAEKAYNYVTRPAKAVSNAASLFSEQSEPQIILLGTSNSVGETSHANFEGFLKEYLKRDVANYAFVGAGIDTSLIAYMETPHYQSSQPKLIVWEIPGYYDLNIMDDKLFNQAIPAAFGECNSNSLLTKTVEIKPSESSTLFAAVAPVEPAAGAADNAVTVDELTLPGTVSESGRSGFDGLSGSLNNKYLHLEFSEPIADKFNVLFRMSDGGTKKQQFDRSERATGDGSFYTLFPREKEGRAITEISLEIPDSFPPSVTAAASICALKKTSLAGGESPGVPQKTSQVVPPMPDSESRATE